jgi:hypothetical protein
MAGAIFDEALAMVEQLSLLERVRLMERIAATLERDMQAATPLPDLYGSWADLNFDISAEEIDDVRREIWANFPREDILE